MTETKMRSCAENLDPLVSSKSLALLIFNIFKFRYILCHRVVNVLLRPQNARQSSPRQG